MRSDDTEKKITPANTHDFANVSLCFLDQGVTSIFAALLRARGIPVQVLGSIVELDRDSLVITEPAYYSIIAPTHSGRCLIVGNPEVTEGTSDLTLRRPLTEEKIDEALAALLAMGSHARR
ncbi:MAG: hypothetical protein K1X83_04875 [Oligoflexia bacterium]|nr:hypothetical protein [Oligoflexia bacterium]